MIKQLLCPHKYKSVGLYYKIESFYGLYEIRLYQCKKCKKCGKENHKIINVFKCYTTDYRKIIDMLERHGAVYYLDYIGNGDKDE